MNTIGLGATTNEQGPTTIQYRSGTAEKLKPCPFCGGTAKRYATDGRNTEWYVMCSQCGCSTSTRHKGRDIEDWNRRANE